MRMVILLLFVCLFGCNSPSPHFRGVDTTRISVGGSTFDVRQKGRLAEAVRLNGEYAPRLGPIARRAEIAMEVVSGCDVIELRGDAAQILGILRCEGDARPLPLAAYVRAQDCDVVDVFVPKNSRTGYLEAECD